MCAYIYIYIYIAKLDRRQFAIVLTSSAGVWEKRANLSGRRGCTVHTCTRATSAGKCHGQSGAMPTPGSARALNLSQVGKSLPLLLLRLWALGFPVLVLVQRQVTDTTSRECIRKMGSVELRLSSLYTYPLKNATTTSVEALENPPGSKNIHWRTVTFNDYGNTRC